ncbi:hypothetical protein [Muriicola sp. Z0-33]|uniref:hypothetical protein n=1 Tax=Muriicola sp. Z0-33 TaxID=2816957 RepID=UPI002237D889|nr:hypothetical protein [Muriicola sp. Z0-33]MCW5515488.1 hypothetical protein [Muriicola sp. Z0-33]
MQQNIPTAYNSAFTNGIRHPHLYLWDAWSFVEDDVIHLYCLAVSRTKKDGTGLYPSERNSYPFHIRHFSSQDEGLSWKDEGCFLSARLGEDKHDSKTIWSGSIEVLPNGKKLTAYTGLWNAGQDRSFLQNIALAVSNDGYTINEIADEPISSPIRDRDEIIGLGYYLDAPDSMGHNDGEGGGPIMAWRDPFVFIGLEGDVHLFWAAKIAPLKNAMAHALLKKEGELFRIDKMYPPTTLPDGDKFTQLELPKLVHDKDNGWYYLIVSTCNRIYEGQSDEEVDKSVRLYRSSSMEGPWEAWGKEGSTILKSENLFGLTVLKTDFKNNRLLCMAPYTDAATGELSLSFAKPFYINLNPVEVHFP